MKKLLFLLTGLLLSIASLQAQNPGELDLTFNSEGLNFGAGTNGSVTSTAVQSDGKIIIGGGFFSSYNAVTRNRIARINRFRH